MEKAAKKSHWLSLLLFSCCVCQLFVFVSDTNIPNSKRQDTTSPYEEIEVKFRAMEPYLSGYANYKISVEGISPSKSQFIT